MTPEELRAARERLAKCVADMRTLNDAFKGRAFDAESKEKYERMEADFDALNSEIKRAERLSGFEAELNTPTREAVREGFGKQGGDDDGDEAAYKREFFSFVQGRSFNPEVLKRTMNAGTNADGGYTIPVVLQKNVVRALLDSVFIRQLGTVISTTSATQIPLGTTKPTFALIAENGAYPETDTKFGIKTLNAYKVGGVIKASEELLNDSGIDIENYITTLMVEGIAAFEEDKFVNGTGSTDFTGLTKGTVGKTTVATNAVTADEIMDMYYSVANKYRPNASWVISDDFEKAVMKLKDSTGRYIWQLGLQAGAPNMLLNRPVYNSAYMPSLGTGNAIAVFGDLKYYQIGDRGSMNMKRLNELYAGNGQIGFQVAKRGDAKIILDEAIKVMKNA